MILTRHNLLRFLLSNNCISLRELLNDCWEVHDYSSKNNNFAFISSSKGLFIKQCISDGDKASLFGLERESDCYILVGGLASLNGIIPKLIHYFEKERILVTEYVVASINMFSYCRSNEVCLQRTASLLGMELSRCHFSLSQVVKFSDKGVKFVNQKPSIFTPEIMSEGGDVSIAQRQCLNIVKKHSDLMNGLTSLDSEWRVNGLIHNDMKLENCLVRFSNEDPEKKSIVGVTFIDWERVNIGDIAWDLAGIIEGYLTLLSSAMQQQAKKTHLFDHSLELGEISGQVRAALRVFWAAYIEGSKIEPTYTHTLLKRVAKYSAARLIQSTYNKLEGRDELGLDALLQIQLAQNLLSDPELNREKLFGF
ncbi:phosphotransferase [Enterovibrio makurazakiensis]|uniref:phosphotransferase family protein n=1 Tax=Enterovibrio makurazakiensis TaxID=2910232 RepID=UPI003D1F8F3C